jgi:hypothetical protein
MSIVRSVFFHRSVFFLFFVLFILGFSHTVFAQNSAGTKIIPATIEERGDPGGVITETLTITNIENQDKEYYLYKRDIKGVDVGGVPIFAEESEATGYEISEWIELDPEPIIIPALGEVSIPITINIPENATPGSHFGGIFVSVEPPRLREIGAGVGYEVASIVSIRISGDVIDSARIRSFSTDKLFYGSKNVNFTAKIENQGNILIRPRGPLTIRSMFGGDPSVMTINDSLAGVFPGTLRDLTFSWNDEGLGFGRYEAVLALGYEGDNGQKTIDASLVFWVFPTKVVIPLMVTILVLIGGGYLFTKMYINRAIMRAAGGRRMPAGRYRRQVGISRFAFVMSTLLAVFALFLIVVLIFFA